MSALYNLEPQPTAKVLLNTTTGDLVLELFAKQAPLASRNFLQHCLDGYYNGTIFHRLVPGFIIQGGDPSGLGTGGISAINNGAPFEDEFHSRLKFNRRGLLGMANSGEPNDNTSQFFLTLDQTPELQAKNTMFGRIEGDTIYNLMKMAEADLAEDGSDRPLYPTRILTTEILVNPFEDMVQRMHIAAPAHDQAPKAAKKKRKAAKILLSFAADDGEEAVPSVPKKAKVNPNFVSAAPDKKASIPAAAPEKSKENRTIPAPRLPSDEPYSETPADNGPKQSQTPAPFQSADQHLNPTPKSKPQPPLEEKQLSKLDKVNQQIAELKASMKRNTGPVEITKEEKKSALEAMIPATSTRGRKRGKVADESGALQTFNSFKKRLEHMPLKATAEAPETNNDSEKSADGQETEASAPVAAMDTEEKLCDLHFIANCQSCKAWDQDDVAANNDDDDDDNDAEWMSHALSFAKDTLGKDLEWRRKMDEFEVIDPREKAKEIQKDNKRDKRHNQGSGRDWDKQRDKDKPRTKT